MEPRWRVGCSNFVPNFIPHTTFSSMLEHDGGGTEFIDSKCLAGALLRDGCWTVCRSLSVK